MTLGRRTPVVLVAAGAVVLLATAAFHASGHGDVARQAAASSLEPFLAAALPTLWLFFSWHLAAVALGVVASLFAAAATTRAVALGCGFVAAVDFLWVLSLAGFFAGTALLVLASLLLLAGGLSLGLSPRTPPAAARSG